LDQRCQRATLEKRVDLCRRARERERVRRRTMKWNQQAASKRAGTRRSTTAHVLHNI